MADLLSQNIVHTNSIGIVLVLGFPLANNYFTGRNDTVVISDTDNLAVCIVLAGGRQEAEA